MTSEARAQKLSGKGASEGSVVDETGGAQEHSEGKVMSSANSADGSQRGRFEELDVIHARRRVTLDEGLETPAQRLGGERTAASADELPRLAQRLAEADRLGAKIALEVSIS